MPYYRRHLPHLYHGDQAVFLTWCLHHSLPPDRPFPEDSLTSGKAFALLDRLLDETRAGPFYLRQPAIAGMVVECIHHHADVLARYSLHAFVVMPNHVHLLVSPRVPLPKLTKSLKGFTARQANQMLALTGTPFWQEETYDHLVRSTDEWERIKFYIEQNPVRAGLVRQADEYAWSSAATGRSPADPAVRPTTRDVAFRTQGPMAHRADLVE